MNPEEAIMRIQDHMVVHHMAESPHCDMIAEALEMSIRALDKLWVGKKPIVYKHEEKNDMFYLCRSCHCEVGRGVNHCPICGQAMDWANVLLDNQERSQQ